MVSQVVDRIIRRSESLAGVRRQLTELEHALQIRFQIWERAVGWQCLDPYDHTSPAPASTSNGIGHLTTAEIQELLKQTYSAFEPTLTTVQQGQYVVVVPISCAVADTCAAVSLVETQDLVLLRRMLSMCALVIRQQRELDERGDQLDEYARQVSKDLEELAWLRRLAEHIEFCGATNGIEQVASAVLPELCQMLNAESISLFSMPHSADDAGPRGLVRAASVFRTGSTAVDDETCQRLVDYFGHCAQTQPIVQNHMADHEGFGACQGLDSCVLVPVANKDFRFGYLLAINKCVPLDSHESGLGVEGTGAGMSEREFGTVEASLLDAAAVMLATHAQNAELFRDKESLLVGILRALINAIDAKDPYTCGHSDRVALIAKRLAEELHLDGRECERIYMTGLLHDVGKIGIPDDVLLKPERLTNEEFEKIKQHPQIGYNILRHLKQLSYALPGVLHHHESLDGRGYPHQLRGGDIPLVARILAVADAYDAMSSSRPYRNAMPFERAERVLRDNAGTQWDAQIVDAFFAALDDMHAIYQSSDAHTQDILQWDAPDFGLSAEFHHDAIVTAVTSTREAVSQ